MKVCLNIETLQRERISKGLSQRGLSEAAGVSTIVINSMERKKSTPTPRTLKKICDALEIDVMDICTITN